VLDDHLATVSLPNHRPFRASARLRLAILGFVPRLRSGPDGFYYEACGGTGEKLVVIPGLALDVSELGPLVTQLATQFAVTAVDNLGAGRSDKPDEPYTLERMAAGIAVLLRDVAGPATVLGISMGSKIALTLALQQPELVTRLVLVSGAARGHRSVYREILLNTLPRLPVGKGKYPQSYAAFRRQRMASAGIDLRDRLARVAAPALIAHGRRDRITPPALVTELAAGLPEARLEWFDGGHLFPLRPAGARWLTAETAAFVNTN
jgi:pimeloyl-ACP methyl ester carboxylesterase